MGVSSYRLSARSWARMLSPLIPGSELSRMTARRSGRASAASIWAPVAAMRTRKFSRSRSEVRNSCSSGSASMTTTSGSWFSTTAAGVTMVRAGCAVALRKSASSWAITSRVSRGSPTVRVAATSGMGLLSEAPSAKGSSERRSRMRRSRTMALASSQPASMRTSSPRWRRKRPSERRRSPRSASPSCWRSRPCCSSVALASLAARPGAPSMASAKGSPSRCREWLRACQAS